MDTEVSNWVETMSADELARSVITKLNAMSIKEKERAILALVKRGNREKEIERLVEHLLFKCLTACFSVGRPKETERGTKALLASLAVADDKP